MITEDYVSFEIAKLLKEKGFDEYTFSDYSEEGVIGFNEVETRIAKGYQRPTLQMAMKWLREKYKFLITIDLGIGVYVWTITNIDEYTVVQIDAVVGTYEEACEAAIKYCLLNLIQNG